MYKKEDSVDKNIAKYIREGKRRGFSVNLLRRKLLEGGFNEKDIGQALASLKGGSKEAHVDGPMPKLPKQRVLSKKDLHGTEVTGTRWMKTGGVSGLILFFLGLLGFLISLLTVLPFIFGDGRGTIFGFQNIFGGGISSSTLTISLIVSLAGSLVSSILGLLFWIGFIHVGKSIKSKKLELAAKLVVILGGLSILGYLVLIAYTFTIGAGASGLGTIALISKLVFIFPLLTFVSLLFFSILMIKVKEIKYTLLTGILFLIVSVYALIVMILYSLLLFFPSLLLSITGVVFSIVLALANPATSLFVGITLLAGILFGSLLLLEASKEYE